MRLPCARFLRWSLLLLMSTGACGGSADETPAAGTTGDEDATPAAAAPAAASPSAAAASGLTDDAIREVVRANAAEIRECHESAVARGVGDGTVVVALTIHASGAVVGAEVVESSYSATDEFSYITSACVTRAVSDWRFPAPDPATLDPALTTVIRVPLELRATAP